MPATTSDSPGFAATRAQRHPHCWVCSSANESGLAVEFQEDGLGGVEGRFPCPKEYTGYPGLLHGGVTSALLDGAMTNCLMALGTPGVTADLQVRFLRPVLIGKPVTVRAWLDRSRGPVSILGAELRQDGEILATAVGKFMNHPDDKRSKKEG
ncbi:MAG: PaaI family thioesterase [Candidatus Krumholzibacteria bacterium]|nr:PaaI family thioesterase [Candidatus Krumholzibacteria bacterium]